MQKKEKLYLFLVTVLGITLMLFSILDLAVDFSVPGVQPLLASLLWLFL